MKDMRSELLQWFMTLTFVLTVAAFFALLGGEAYIRWFVNRDFMFLGGDGIAGLALLVGIEFAALLYAQKK